MTSGLSVASYSSAETRLTCRHWLLDPAGCLDHQCRYSHTITGVLSPPSIFACYAFNNEGCPLSQDQCLFTHLIARPDNPHVQIRHSELTLFDAPIAEAAARAGFDCSDWPKLKGLIDAVRGANEPVSYPDRWTGPAAFQSDIYPDRWKADYDRPRRRTTQTYRGFDRTPTVPFFISRGQQSARPVPSKLPLRPRTSNKRNSAVIDVLSSTPKRAKIDPSSTPNIIDLTQDNEVTTRFVPRRRPRPRRALSDISTNATGRKKFPKGRMTARSAREQHVHGESLGTLANIASKLRACVHAIIVDRQTLRHRWEVDEALQLQHVTDNLADLNECFTAAENGIWGALEVIEQRLL